MDSIVTGLYSNWTKNDSFNLLRYMDLFEGLSNQEKEYFARRWNDGCLSSINPLERASILFCESAMNYPSNVINLEESVKEMKKLRILISKRLAIFNKRVNALGLISSHEQGYDLIEIIKERPHRFYIQKGQVPRKDTQYMNHNYIEDLIAGKTY